MKKILIYGDSNTWGQDGQENRYPAEKQWPNILQARLGTDYKITQSGLCARVAGDFEQKAHRNGQTFFEVVFRTETPVDILVVALGTNDLKKRFNRTAQQIVKDLLWYGQKAKDLEGSNEGVETKVLYVAPPNLQEIEDFEGALALREEVANLLESSAQNVLVIDGLKMSEDGLHFSESAHQDLADTLDKRIKEGLL